MNVSCVEASNADVTQEPFTLHVFPMNARARSTTLYCCPASSQALRQAAAGHRAGQDFSSMPLESGKLPKGRRRRRRLQAVLSLLVYFKVTLVIRGNAFRIPADHVRSFPAVITLSSSAAKSFLLLRSAAEVIRIFSRTGHKRLLA